MEYAIIYVRITDDKTEGIEFSGPWLGATEKTKEAADLTVMKMTAESKGSAIIAKIFELADDNYGYVKQLANRYFERVQKEMNESKEILDRPIKRRKKKKKNVKRLDCETKDA